MDIAHLAAVEPRALVGSDTGIYHHGLMAVDGIECQCGSIVCHVDYLAVGHKSQLDKCLEAVADTQHKTVTVPEEVVNSVLYLGVAEECCDELSASLGLVTAAEAAGDHNDLGASYCSLEVANALLDIACGQVADNDYLGLSACLLKGTGSIVLAVCSREYGDKHSGLCDLCGSRELYAVG